MSGHEFLLSLAAIGGGTAFLLSPVTIVRVVLKHRERMAEIRYGKEGAPVVNEELQRLRQEVAELRETSTRFDMSFDAGLARVEDRLTSVEQEQTRGRYNTTTTSKETISIGRSG